MKTLKNGKYASIITKKLDGEYTLMNLYNYDENNREEANVYSMKEYKTEKTAERFAKKYLNSHFCQPQN